MLLGLNKGENVSSSPSVVQKLGRAALDFVFPPRCAACGASGDDFLCGECRDALVPAEPPRCPRCWRPDRARGPVCARCRAAPPAFDALRASFVYTSTARDLVHALKFRGVTAVAGAMATLMASTVREYELEVDAVVAVPLAGLRRRTRGYNQAQALARPLARELGLPVLDRALVRRRPTRAQARSADIEERRRNVAGAFAAREGEVTGRRLLLVDDVTTTGATLDACAGALQEGESESVFGLAFATED